jgi:N-acetylneuraminic acid mutarotase
MASCLGEVRTYVPERSWARSIRTLSIALGCLWILVASGCGGGSSSPAPAPTPTLQSISVTPQNSSLAAGLTQQYSATAHYSDGSSNAAMVTWSTSDSSLGTINSTGLLTAVKQGDVTISASSGAITGSTSLTIGPPNLLSIAVSPQNPTVWAGQTQQFTATGSYTDGSTQNLNGVTWSSGTTTVATIANSGLASSRAAGTTMIQATSGNTSGSTTLNVAVGTFAVDVTVLGLWGTGGGLVLTDNDNDPLPVTANGSFTFPTEIQSGDSYSVTVLTQPASPAQTCAVSGGSGIVTGGAVNVSIDCGHGEWAWMGGSTSSNQPGTYGTSGVPAANNIPGSRMSTARWVDKQGTLWLFGGAGLDSGGNEGQLNDLWRFDGQQWTWIGGSDLVDQAGIYGGNGAASASNWPGARGDASTWVDAEGNFWLFGGFGFDSTGTRGYLNDLWEYSAGQWTWVSGSQFINQSGSYGTMGTPSPSNIPGGRYSGAAWLGSDGSFWLYGGAGFDSSGQNGYLSDLWKYRGGEWTWIAGPTVWGQNAVYGTQGVASASNSPGARHGEATWTDSSGNLWLFGGVNGVFLNDIWKFSNGQWTWEAGSSGAQVGVYGTQGVAAAGNTPGGRFFPVAWQDVSGNIWIFGGVGLDANGGPLIYLSDLWKYSGGEWTWMGGPMLAGQPAVFGTQGVPAPNNVPGPRYEAVGWVDANQNFWLFGGLLSATSYSNDVWKLLP